MKLSDAINYFGSKRDLANICGFRVALVHLWSFRGFIPLKAQFKIQETTAGKLQASFLDVNQ